MNAFAYLYIAVAGVLQTIQGGANTHLRKVLDQPWITGLWVYFLGLVGFGLACAVVRPALPSWQQVTQVPWWAMLGGGLGVFVIYGQLNFAGRVGAGPFNGIMVTSAIITSLALDHFGVLGFQAHPINLWRVLGGALMVAGITLIAVF